MLIIREKNEKRMVLGTGKWEERIGLFFFVGTIFIVILSILYLAEASFERPILIQIILNGGYYIGSLGLAGAYILFFKRKIILFRPQEVIYIRKGLGKPAMIPRGSLIEIRTRKITDRTGVAIFYLKDEKEEILARGEWNKLLGLAREVADYLSAPLNNREDFTTHSNASI